MKRVHFARAAFLAVALLSVAALGQVALAKGGWLGVELQIVDPDLRDALKLGEREGVLVSSVVEDSPAEKAGIEEGDVILRMDGQDVTGVSRFARRVRNADPGSDVVLDLVSNGERKTLSVELGDEADHRDEVVQEPRRHEGLRAWRHAKRPQLPSMPEPPESIEHLQDFFSRPRLGVQTRAIDEDLAGYFDAKAGQGVVVLEVMKDTPAEKAGVKVGDVILRVGNTTITSPSDLRDALLEHEGDAVSLEIQRKGRPLTLDTKLQSPSESWSRRGFTRSDFPEDLRDDLRKEIDELRRELGQLREELRRLERD